MKHRQDISAASAAAGRGPDLRPYRNCRLCPRFCGVDRTSGRTGFCRETAICRVSSACVHHGEEPAISGRRGSGTIFFTGCSTRCFFCQNWQISHEGMGDEVTPEELLAAAKRLIRRGVHNLNFVTPDHFLPHILWLCRRLRSEGETVPFVYNCSGYMTRETVDLAAGVVDIFMPDFKFSDPELAAICMGDRTYPDLAATAIQRMFELKGPLRPFDPRGRRTARTGVLVRHLVLPGHVDNSLGILRTLHRLVGPHATISLMSQYHPVPLCFQKGRLTRRLHSTEYSRVVEEAERLGFDDAYIQPDFGDPAYLPDFERDEPFPGKDG